MNRRASRRHAAGVVFLLLGLYAMTALPAAAAEKQYVSTTIRGTLTHPKSDKPLVGAVVRFTATDHDQKDVEALTDDTGTFVAEGLGYGVYAVEIRTADGETIRGINSFPVKEGETVAVKLKLSDRLRSDTSVDNRPDRFAAVVAVEPTKWKRFWRGFGIFMGVVIVTAALIF